MTPDLLKAAQAHAEETAPIESCGLIVVREGSKTGEYIPTRNLATTPDRFAIHPVDWAAAEDMGTVAAVVHSHPGGSADPSEADRMACDVSGIPWVILGEGGWNTIYPVGIPFEGRSFCWGVTDCYSLARCWYAEHGAVLPDFLRAPEFWKSRDLFGEGLESAGFEPIEGLNPDPGDALLFGIHSGGRVNHCAVYLGNGRMLHQPVGRLSIVEPVGAWVRHLAYIARRAA